MHKSFSKELHNPPSSIWNYVISSSPYCNRSMLKAIWDLALGYWGHVNIQRKFPHICCKLVCRKTSMFMHLSLFWFELNNICTLLKSIFGNSPKHMFKVVLVKLILENPTLCTSLIRKKYCPETALKGHRPQLKVPSRRLELFWGGHCFMMGKTGQASLQRDRSCAV